MFPGNFHAAMDTYRGVSVGSIVESAAPHQLVRMLFDGARAAVAAAKGHLMRREIAAKGEVISKAISIIDGGLKASLDLNVGGEMAKNLYDLYAYMALRLLHANLKNDVAALDEVAQLLEQLGGAWETIAAKDAAKATAATAPAVSSGATRAPQAPTPNRAVVAAPAKTNAVATGTPGETTGFAPVNATPIYGAAAINSTSQRSRLAAAYGVR